MSKNIGGKQIGLVLAGEAGREHIKLDVGEPFKGLEYVFLRSLAVL
jgi:hypothetical protein